MEAIYDYWTYYEPIRVYAEQSCVLTTQRVINMMDNLLLGKDNATTAELKAAFGLPNVTYDSDFAFVVGYAMDAWQGKNWDPDENDPSFDVFCSAITNSSIIYPETKALTRTVQDLLKKGGYGAEVDTLTTPILNWIGWLAGYAVSNCEGDQDVCFSTHRTASYKQDDITATWRSWPYQVRFNAPEADLILTKDSTVHNGAFSQPAVELPKASSHSSLASEPWNGSPSSASKHLASPHPPT